MAAAYEATGTSTDDESFGFSLSIQNPDGTTLPLDEYAFEYEIVGCGVTLSLNEASGITVDLINDLVVIDPGATYRLSVGTYKHGFRCTHATSGKTTQLFDGTWTVTEGNFA